MLLKHRAAPLLGLAALATIGLAAQPAHAQNLLTNGSFEEPGSNYSQSLESGSTAIPGWTTTNAEVLWLHSGDYSLTPSDGTYFLDLTGHQDNSSYGGVTQTISTTTGSQYALTFDIGSYEAPNNAFRGPMSVTASTTGTTPQTFTFTAPTGSSGNVWGTQTLDFTATNSLTTISLVGTASAGGQYLGLDNTSVTDLSAPAAPEPSTWLPFAFMGLAATGLILKAKKRRTA